MNIAETRPPQLLYEGSVKRVWQAKEHDDRLWFEFTDDYSVFDWGKMPDTIANKGRALAILGAHLFHRLQDARFWQQLPQSAHLKSFDGAFLQQRFDHKVYKGKGGVGSASEFQPALVTDAAATHFTGLVNSAAARLSDLRLAAQSSEPVYMEVMAAKVHRPTLHKFQQHSLYLYRDGIAQSKSKYSERRLIPLEVVFRFGMPGGSSLKERLEKDPDYILELGLSKIPQEGTMFDRTVIEFFTKLEPKDRLLSWQEAAVISGLTGEEFEAMTELALDTALALYTIFAERGIELWDGKVEMLVEGGKVMLADSIGPDELRLIHSGCQLSKEMIRMVYRGTPWEKSLKQAQQMARLDNSRSWKEIAVQELKSEPDPLPAPFKAVVDKLYGVLCNHVVGEELFANHPTLQEFVQSVAPATQASAKEETKNAAG